MGVGQPGRMVVAATHKCKENAVWKDKEREEFGGFDDEFFYYHALYVGYNVPNTLYTTIKTVQGNAPWQASRIPYRDVTRTLWLGGGGKVELN